MRRSWAKEFDLSPVRYSDIIASKTSKNSREKCQEVALKSEMKNLKKLTNKIRLRKRKNKEKEKRKRKRREEGK